MALPNTIVNKTVFANKVQGNLYNNLVMAPLCDPQFDPQIHPGKTINFPWVNKGQARAYTFSTNPSGGIAKRTFTADTYDIDQVYETDCNFDEFQNQQAHADDIESEVIRDLSETLAERIDQFAIQKGVSGANRTVAGGTITTSNALEIIGQGSSYISAAGNRGMKQRCMLVDPFWKELLAQRQYSGFFTKADEALSAGVPVNSTGYIGERAGVSLYETNNLPHSVVHTIVTIPTAGNSFSYYGVTFTWTASGAATNPGDISIGASAAAAQANFVLAINGTGTPGPTTYIELSDENRNILKGRQIAATSFSSNASTVTGYGDMSPTITTTPADNTIGTETASTIIFERAAVSLTMQQRIKIKMATEPQNFSDNWLAGAMYGGGVWYRMKPRVTKVTFNAITF